jgi:hypothetical protein
VINKTLFQFRYKLAEFLIAGDIFSNIIDKPDFADLKGLSLIQHDKGFYLTAYRLVEQLTQLDTRSPEDTEVFKQKILDGRTLYFVKHPLESAANDNIKEKLAAAKSNDDLVAAKLFDTLVFKAIYDTYFMAYEVPEFAYEFLDDATAQLANSSIPINAFNVFTVKTLDLISGLFDLEDNTAAKAVLKMFKKHKYMSSYVQFLALSEHLALVKPAK